MEPLKISVLGAGHGGLATAGHLALKGNSVTVFSFFSNELSAIDEMKGIKLEGDVEGFADNIKTAYSINEAVSDADLILIISPALSHKTYASLLSGCLKDGQTVLLSPGRTFGAIEFAKTLKRFAFDKDIILGEAQTFMYATESRGPAHVLIMKEKNVMRVAALPASNTAKLVETMQKIYPQIEAGENVFETSLNNVGGIVHPAPMLLNTSKLDEAAKGADVRYYRDVITKTICDNVMEVMDNEKVSVAAGMGLQDPWTTKKWYEQSYGITGETLYDVLQNNHYYLGFHAPKHFLAYHHVLDEVPNSLVPISEVGKILGIFTPAIDSIIDLAVAIVKVDFWQEGRTLYNLGLHGMSAEELIDFVS